MLPGIGLRSESGGVAPRTHICDVILMVNTDPTLEVDLSTYGRIATRERSHPPEHHGKYGGVTLALDERICRLEDQHDHRRRPPAGVVVPLGSGFSPHATRSSTSPPSFHRM